MKHLVLSLLLLVPLSASAELTAWSYTCKMIAALTDVTCEGLMPPEVIITRATDHLLGGVAGFHITGEPYVFVSPDTSSLAAVTVHETVHYIIGRTALTHNRCEGEVLARYIADQTWDESDRRQYGCPD